MRRLAAVAIVAAALAACGGSDDSAGPPSGPPAKSSAQLAAEKLLRQLQAVGDCDCTGQARARDRLADGRAERREDGYLLEP